jgi:catechol 2,3-dioxygenase-like lactoylglutathione lyase family enzyme
MIGYVTLGSNDLPRAIAFYEALLGELGATRTWEAESGVSWGVKRGPSLAVMKPFNGEPATAGNGTMVALAMKSREDVDRLYAKAISLGAKDEGLAGPRGEGFYAGYFRDPDGNKLCLFFMG